MIHYNNETHLETLLLFMLNTIYDIGCIPSFDYIKNSTFSEEHPFYIKDEDKKKTD